MKTFPFIFCGIMAISAQAQVMPQQGYKLLVESGRAYVAGDEVLPVAKNLSAQKNLRRQRANVTRNSRALQLMRKALKAGIEPPLLANINTNFSNNSNWRKLARLLAQESAVRVAEGNFIGAIDSHLDAIEIGASVARNGAVIDSLVGLSIENIGRSNMEIVAAKLNAAQCLATSNRLLKIEKLRPSLSEILRGEAAFVRREAAKVLVQPRDLAKLAEDEDFQEATDAEKRIMLEMTPAELNRDLNRLVEAAVKRTALSYQAAKKTRLPAINNPNLKSVVELFEGPNLRFQLEKNVTQDRLWRATLELRAQKLKSGVYPLTFVAAIDPFSENKPLIYKREGETYRLYSVGPDGKDDGAGKLENFLIDEETGVESASEHMTIYSRGDILAPKF